jgi:serine/threonine protein kinase
MGLFDNDSHLYLSLLLDRNTELPSEWVEVPLEISTSVSGYYRCLPPQYFTAAGAEYSYNCITCISHTYHPRSLSTLYYLITGVGANGEKVAVKFEKHGARCPQLRHEYKVYRELQNAPGFAKVHYFGTQDSYNLMVMDLLGPSLEDQFNKCGRRFSLKTVLMVADQMLERVELMHSRHLIHRDIKPANFVTDGGRGNGNFIYCIDFGLSKRYRHPRTLQHIPQREGRSLTGTPRYASINNHLGVEQSRRDDLESIGYVLVYFLKGGLPWQGLKAKSATKKYKLIMEKKQSITIPALCQGCPSQFAEYLAYCRSLKFEAKPNIAYLRGMFRDLFRSQGYTNNHSSLDWDWNRHEAGGATEAGRERMEGAGVEEGRY